MPPTPGAKPSSEPNAILRNICTFSNLFAPTGPLQKAQREPLLEAKIMTAITRDAILQARMCTLVPQALNYLKQQFSECGLHPTASDASLASSRTVL